jgi:hypothetical protein
LKTRNDVVFNGASPRIDQALLLAQEEADLWMLAGGKGLRALVVLDHSVVFVRSRVVVLVFLRRHPV